MTKSVFTAHYSRLCEFLIQARINAGMSQAALARCLNRPQSFVSKYEGKQRRLDVVELLEVAHCLQTDGLGLVARLLEGWPNHEGVKMPERRVDGAGAGRVNGDGVKADGVRLDGVRADGVKGNGTRAARRGADGVNGALRAGARVRTDRKRKA